MFPRISLVGVIVLVLSSGLVFQLLQNRFSSPLLAFSSNPEIVSHLEDSLADQRELARRDPERETFYHQRFSSIHGLVSHLYVIDHNRSRIAARYEQIVLSAFSGLVLLVAGAFVWQRGRQEARLDRVQEALAALADGRTDIVLGERGRDSLGKIARMIERTSRRMARDRRRLAALRNLSAWQEAARRHAHEMRTPLTGAKLELTRLTGLLDAESLNNSAEIHQAAQSAGQEIERLGTFTKQFTSFARLPSPERKTWDLGQLLEEFVVTFEIAWPNLRLDFDRPPAPAHADLDRDMLRQVLVNLCDNSSLALGDKKGRVIFDLEMDDSQPGKAVRGRGRRAAQPAGREAFRAPPADPWPVSPATPVVLRVVDDGPGIAEEVRPRLFEPYTTTRKIGHGMGLGLAISKKILLDHDGDLELESTSTDGTIFRLTLPPSTAKPSVAPTSGDTP